MPHLMFRKHIVSIDVLACESERVDDCHAASLVLIMLAIGAIHLSEYDFAQSAYEASCLLLAQVNLITYDSGSKILTVEI